MLETYKAANKDSKFIHISLAHFESATNLLIESDDYNQSVEVDKRIVEKKIPQTHFKIKHLFSPKRMLVILAMLTLFPSFLFFLLNRIAEPLDIFAPSNLRGLEFVNILLSKGGFKS